MVTVSPYDGLAPSEWKAKTQDLIDAYPLKPTDIVETTLEAWASIFQSSIGGFHIGQEIFPKPQTMGFFLHELIPLELSKKFPGVWREDRRAGEKDLVYVPDPALSAEIKTSSHPSKIFGNRSYAQESNSTKKDKSGYYVAVNFKLFSFHADGEPDKTKQPEVVRIRFGWLDRKDWTGQTAATGQQANLSPEVESGKLLVIYTGPGSTTSQISLF